MDERRGLTQNQLKLIAVLSMTVDHVGVLLFPKIELLRILGRLSFPIFAFSIYEGAKYTRQPWRYLLRMAGLGLACLLVYDWYADRLFGNILITFSLSLSMLLSLRFWREGQRRDNRRQAVTGLLLTVGSLLLTVLVCRFIDVDYGLPGCVLPLFAAACDADMAAPAALRPADRHRQWYPLLGFSVGLLALSIWLGGIQYYSLLALPLLAMSGHKRGKLRLKYFFYLYYPLHLLALEGISRLSR